VSNIFGREVKPKQPIFVEENSGEATPLCAFLGL
jgi:hypothetical protein